MKVRGLKQVLHWSFLLVGVFSLIMMGITVNTYLGYAQEGYGLKMSFESATLNYGHWLVLKFYFENPGGMDIEITGGNMTLSQTYEIEQRELPNGLSQQYPALLPAHENTSVVIWISISDSDLENILTSGQADINLDLLLFVPERYMSTHITFQASVGVNI